MSGPLRQLRRTAVRAISDPDSFHLNAEISQALNLCRGSSQSQASPVGIDDPESIKPTVGVDDFALQDVIAQRKSNMPLRLICTEDGKLYGHNAIEARFKAEHASFFDPDAVSFDARMMLDAVESSFAYAMFSHRWEGVEPLYKDLEGSDVFSLVESPGTRKLQHFCRHAREHGFRWAWSDTCCIDKASTSELQESIITMFKWYRNSDLTIIHLGDVFDDSIEALKKSAWFLRGWTLQELIAPQRIIFFKSDWTLLVTSVDLPLDNYKTSPTFCKLITEITGIDDDALTNFDPASHHITIRQRMSWAAHRKTTEIEDIAYCLMGIFNVHFPVMYGEGDGAFNRLQIEIMAVSDDPSLFDWTGKPGTNTFLASSPVCFDPFTPPIVEPVSLTLRLENMLKRVPLVQKALQEVDTLTVDLFNLKRRLCTDVQHPAHYMAGAKIHCHGLEYTVRDVEETKAMSDAHNGNGKRLFQYHIIAESLHPITVTLEEPIDTGFGLGRLKSKYMCIFRVWDQSLATGQSPTEDNVDHPLRQPFVAHLLASEPGGIYRRIQAKNRIVAKLDQPVEFRLILQLRTLMIK